MPYTNEIPYAEFIDAMELSEGRVRLERPQAAVARLVLDDAENMNALSGELTVELHRKLADVVADRRVRVIQLAGEG